MIIEKIPYVKPALTHAQLAQQPQHNHAWRVPPIEQWICRTILVHVTLDTLRITIPQIVKVQKIFYDKLATTNVQRVPMQVHTLALHAQVTVCRIINHRIMEVIPVRATPVTSIMAKLLIVRVQNYFSSQACSHTCQTCTDATTSSCLTCPPSSSSYRNKVNSSCPC